MWDNTISEGYIHNEQVATQNILTDLMGISGGEVTLNFIVYDIVYPLLQLICIYEKHGGREKTNSVGQIEDIERNNVADKAVATLRRGIADSLVGAPDSQGLPSVTALFESFISFVSSDPAVNHDFSDQRLETSVQIENSRQNHFLSPEVDFGISDGRLKHENMISNSSGMTGLNVISSVSCVADSLKHVWLSGGKNPRKSNLNLCRSSYLIYRIYRK